MTRLQKWDKRVIAHGNRQEWIKGSIWFGFSNMRTLKTVVGAWGLKRNLIWMGTWKVGN